VKKFPDSPDILFPPRLLFPIVHAGHLYFLLCLDGIL
jgi:hypothetical protein